MYGNCFGGSCSLQGTARLREPLASVDVCTLTTPSSFQNFLLRHRHSRTSCGGIAFPELLPAAWSFRTFFLRHRHSGTSCGGIVIPELLAAAWSFQNFLLRRRHSRTSCCAVVIPELLAAPSSFQNVLRRHASPVRSCPRKRSLLQVCAAEPAGRTQHLPRTPGPDPGGAARAGRRCRLSRVRQAPRTNQLQLCRLSRVRRAQAQTQPATCTGQSAAPTWPPALSRQTHSGCPN